MQENTERADPDAAADGFVAGTVDVARSERDTRYRKPGAVLPHEFFLFHLCIAIGLAAELRACFHRAGLIQFSSLGLIPIRVDCEGADVDKALQAALLDEM